MFANAGIGERVWLPSQTAKEGEYVKPDLTVSFCIADPFESR
jgi:hypothetical protein